METMLIEIACADIDSRSIQMRRDHRNVTERSIVLFKAEAANELRKIGVITVVEHGVIRAAPIQLNDIVDLRPQLALGEFPRAHTADLFLFTKKDMAPTLAHQQQDHIHQPGHRRRSRKATSDSGHPQSGR